MTKTLSPNNPFIKFRFWLADKIRVFPPEGEAWCVNCVRNDGKTVIVPVSGMQNHLRDHQPNDYVKIITEEGDRAKWGNS